jgi:hypothetical protein
MIGWMRKISENQELAGLAKMLQTYSLDTI